MSGIKAIFDERARQRAQEGFDATHDDQHTGGELLLAADCYIWAALTPGEARQYHWPWDPAWWKPSADPAPDVTVALPAAPAAG